MKMMGIKKKVDNLGRICIPKPMGELYGLGNVVELVVTNEGGCLDLQVQRISIRHPKDYQIKNLMNE